MDSLVFTDAGSSGTVAVYKETSRQRATYPSNDKRLMNMENYFTKSTSQPPFNLTWKTNLVLCADENSILFSIWSLFDQNGWILVILASSWTDKKCKVQSRVKWFYWMVMLVNNNRTILDDMVKKNWTKKVDHLWKKNKRYWKQEGTVPISQWRPGTQARIERGCLQNRCCVNRVPNFHLDDLVKEKKKAFQIS